MRGEAWWFLEPLGADAVLDILAQLRNLHADYVHPVSGDLRVLEDAGPRPIRGTGELLALVDSRESLDVQLWLGPDSDTILSISRGSDDSALLVFDLDGLDCAETQVLLSAVTWVALSNPWTRWLVADHRLPDTGDAWLAHLTGDHVVRPDDADVLLVADRGGPVSRCTVTVGASPWCRPAARPPEG